MEISYSAAMGKFVVNYVVTHPKRRYLRDRCWVNSGFVLHSYSCWCCFCLAAVWNWRPQIWSGEKRNSWVHLIGFQLPTHKTTFKYFFRCRKLKNTLHGVHVFYHFMFMVPCIIIYSMKQPTDAAICSQFYSTARFTLHVSGVLHTHRQEYNF